MLPTYAIDRAMQVRVKLYDYKLFQVKVTVREIE
jgi:hypothetical protein